MAINTGVGQYWDWTFPYYADQISNLFTYRYLSWTNQDFGSPLLYSSDYFLRMFIAPLGFLNPENLRYVLLVAIFGLGAFGIFLISANHTRYAWAYLLGIGAFINPAVIYKLTAGHFNYLVAYALLIYLIYFLFYKYEKNLKSAVIAGLLLAFMGVQIQFLIIGALLITLFLFLNTNKFSTMQVLVIGGIAILLHMVWLSNFLTGGANVAGTSSAAAAVSVEGSTTSAYSNIFTFNFSRATLIDKFYTPYALLWHSLLFIFLPLFYLQKSKKNKLDPKNITLLLFLLILIVLATGILQLIAFHPLSILTPLFREVGHFAPLIIMSLLLILAFKARENILSYSFFIVLGIATLFGINVYYDHPQNLKYAEIREKFQPIKSFIEKDNATARILYYPFFNQYSFINSNKRTAGNFPLENSGHDSFFTFSGKEFVNNAVPPHTFKESLQYRLLNSYNVDILKPYNIKYIVNVSDIYESNYEQYVPKTTYDNNINLIKNDHAFFAKLLSANPHKLKQVNDSVLEIIDYTPRITPVSALFSIDANTNKDAAQQLVNSLGDTFNYMGGDETSNKPYAKQLGSLFSTTSKESFNISTGALKTGVRSDKEKKVTLYSDLSYADAFYAKEKERLIVYTKPAGDLSLNDERLDFNSTATKVITSETLHPNKSYYIEHEKDITPILEHAEYRIGTVKPGSEMKLVEASVQGNLIDNSSFEGGLWEEKVQNCNNYDASPDIGMQLDGQSKSEGDFSLQLHARKHFACTTTEVAVEENTNYLLSFDYQSPNTDQAHYYISFDDSYRQSLEGTAPIYGADWQKHYTLFQTPANVSKMKLYVYARETDSVQKTINRYDNFSMQKVQKVTPIKTTLTQDRFSPLTATLRAGDNSLTYNGSTYKEASLIKNASFEKGLWQKKVKDCNNHDSQADIGMRISDIATDGNASLELSARRHIACTLIETPFDQSGSYLLNFDVRGKNAKQAGYYFAFNDSNKTILSEQITLKQDDKWQSFSKKISAPAGATSATLYLYAYESDGQTNNIVLYDNFRLSKVPDVENAFYIMHKAQSSMQSPKEIAFSTINSTKKRVAISSAKHPFVLNFAESFHSSWKLYLTPAAPSMDCFSLPTHTYLALTPVKECANAPSVFEGEELNYLKQESLFDDQHIKLNGYANGWTISPDYIRANFSKEYYQENPDGSIDMNLVIYFKPQSYFYIGFAISGVTLAICIVYLVWSATRRKSHKNYSIHPDAKSSRQ